jgi:RNA recognition motif-containing protein
MLDPNTGKSRGTAHVVFNNAESLQIALDCTGTMIRDREIRVDLTNNNNKKGDRGDRGDRDRGKRRDDRGERRGGDGNRGGGFADRSSDKNWNEKVSSRDRGDRAHHDKKSQPSQDSPSNNTNTATPPVPTERPVLKLVPRTLPSETIGKPVAAASNIFGTGKPRDELAFEVCSYYKYYVY